VAVVTGPPRRTNGTTLLAGAGAGHEHYLAELGQLLSAQGPGDQRPTPEAAATMRARHDIHQITPLIPGSITTAPPGGPHE
jgi:hypothetical protein